MTDLINGFAIIQTFIESCKSVDVDEDEIATFIGINVLLVVVKLPSYKNYWSQKLRYPMIAYAMPIKLGTNSELAK